LFGGVVVVVVVAVVAGVAAVRTDGQTVCVAVGRSECRKGGGTEAVSPVTSRELKPNRSFNFVKCVTRTFC
jgi:hypothetical protein